MNFTKLLADVAIVFAVSLLVSAVVSVLLNLIVHRAGTVDWETSFRFAILLGILLPWMGTRRRGD